MKLNSKSHLVGVIFGIWERACRSHLQQASKTKARSQSSGEAHNGQSHDSRQRQQGQDYTAVIERLARKLSNAGEGSKGDVQKACRETRIDSH